MTRQQTAARQPWPTLMKVLDVDLKHARTHLGLAISRISASYGERVRTKEDLEKLLHYVDVARADVVAAENVLRLIIASDYDIDAFEQRLKEVKK